MIKWWQCLIITTVFTALAGGYGLLLGSAVQTAAYEKDQTACANVCEPNGGIEYIKTSAYCVCENGASFLGSDLRK